MGAIRRTISYANVTSTLALVVALGGTGAYAASTIRSGDIVNGQVKHRDLAAGAVDSSTVRNGSLQIGDLTSATVTSLQGQQGQQGAQGIPGLTGPAGPAGPAGADGPAGPAGTIDGVTAGGDLTGTYPNPTLGAKVVGAAQLDVLPVAVARSSTLPFIDTEVFENVTMNFEDVDTTGTMHSTSAGSNHTLVAPVRGLYAITIQVSWNGGNFVVGGYRAIRTNPGIIQSTQATVQSNSGKDVQSASGVMFLEAGASVGLEAATTSPSFVTGLMSMRLVSPYCPAPTQVCATVD